MLAISPPMPPAAACPSTPPTPLPAAGAEGEIDGEADELALPLPLLDGEGEIDAAIDAEALPLGEGGADALEVREAEPDAVPLPLAEAEKVLSADSDAVCDPLALHVALLLPLRETLDEAVIELEGEGVAVWLELPDCVPLCMHRAGECTVGGNGLSGAGIDGNTGGQRVHPGEPWTRQPAHTINVPRSTTRRLMRMASAQVSNGARSAARRLSRSRAI
jgi:hypothetical protein